MRLRNTKLIIFAAAAALCFCSHSAKADGNKTQYLKGALAPQFPPYAQLFSGRYNNAIAMADSLPPTVPYPAQWPYVTSWPFAPGWAYPTWSPYSARWNYSDRGPYYEWWSASDMLAYKDKWTYGDALKATNRFEYPANWPHPTRWSSIDQWPVDADAPSTADTGVIDLVNQRGEAIANGDYTFLLHVGDRVYLTRDNRLLGLARVVKLTPTYVMLQATQMTHDYFLQIGDTFQVVELAPAMDEQSAPSVDTIYDDGRMLSNFDFLARNWKKNDFFTLRRNGQNVGTARIMTLGYGYAILQPSEDTVPQPGDKLMYNQTPQTVLSLVKPKQISGAEKEGIFVSGTDEEKQVIVEKNNQQEQNRALLKKNKNKHQWPDSDIWWEDTYGDPELWPDQPQQSPPPPTPDKKK